MNKPTDTSSRPDWQKNLLELLKNSSDEDQLNSERLLATLDLIGQEPRPSLAKNLIIVCQESGSGAQLPTIPQDTNIASRFWFSLIEAVLTAERESEIAKIANAFKQPIRQATGRESLKVVVDLCIEYRLWEIALQLSDSILNDEPTCLLSQIQKARALRGLRRIDDSIALWTLLTEKHTDEYELWGELGNTHFAARDFEKAIESYRRLAASNPRDINAFLSIYAAELERKNTDKAEEAFAQALLVEGVSNEMYQSIVKAVAQNIDPNQTLRLIERWLECYPDNPVALHFQTTCKARAGISESTGEASKEYIESEFDGFARTFEKQLSLLGYRGPKVLSEFLEELFPQKTVAQTLDAGCGTGWCGPVLRPKTDSLVGIDLSQKMLERAEQKEVYDQLTHSDLVEFLANTPSGFDLIVCLDTLIYFRDLKPAFTGFANALKKDGTLLFSIELLEDNAQADAQLQMSGRYNHSLPSIEKALVDSGLQGQIFERRAMRLEKGDPVYQVLGVIRQQPDDDSLTRPIYRDHSANDRIEIYQELLQKEPTSQIAKFHLGTAYFEQGEVEQARTLLESAVPENQNTATLCSIGSTFAQMGDLKKAFEVFTEGLKVDSDCIPLLNNAGRAAFELGDTATAFDHLERAQELAPGNPKTLAFLGNIVRSRGQHEEAIDYYKKSLEGHPGQPDTLVLLGQAYLELNRFGDAAANFVKAQQLDPQNPLIYDLLGRVNQLRGQVSEASFCFLQALQLTGGDSQIHSRLIGNMTFDQTVDLSDQLAESRAWAQRLRKQIGEPTPATGSSLPSEKQQLRVGYLHPNFRGQVGDVMSLVLPHHNADEFRITLFSRGSLDDRLQSVAQQAGVNHQTIATTDPSQVAKIISEKDLDILVDLGGHEPENVLASTLLRPARASCFWPLEQEFTGLKEQEYLIGDRHVFTKDNKRLYAAEKFVELDGIRPYEKPSVLPDLETTSSSEITFGCIATLPSFSPDMISTVSQIMLDVPGTKLIVGCPGLGDPSVQNRIMETFGKMGVSTSRIHLQAIETADEQFDFWKQTDVALDSFPLNNEAAIWRAVLMGCQIATLAGTGIRERSSASLLHNLGVETSIASTRSEYVELAKQASERIQTTDERLQFRAKAVASDVCDLSRFTLQLEDHFRNSMNSR